MKLEEWPVAEIGLARVCTAPRSVLVEAIMELADRGDRAYLVMTPNIQHIDLLSRNDDFREAYAGASLQTADGWPVALLASVLTGHKVERVTGADLIFELCGLAAGRGLSIAMVGGPHASTRRASERLREQFPGLQVAFVDDLPPGAEADPAYLANLRVLFHELRPAITFLAMGAPRQEVFAHRVLARFVNGVILPIGAGIEFAAGDRRRSPLFLQRLRLEWLFRLALEPKRLGPRYARAALAFAKPAFSAVRGHLDRTPVRGWFAPSRIRIDKSRSSPRRRRPT